MSTEALREEICRRGASLFERGLTFGSTGNMSVRLDDGGWLMTPTNASLGELDPYRLSVLDAAGVHVAGDPPTKEAPLHFAFYRQRSTARAVVHLHSTHAVAVSCLSGLDVSDCLPPLTAYYAMRVGRLPLISYLPPGDRGLAGAIEALADTNHAVLLANHGPIVAGPALDMACYAIEELEETARIFLLLNGHSMRPLSPTERTEIERRFGNLLPLEPRND